MSKVFFSIELCYLGIIDLELDKAIDKVVSDTFSKFKQFGFDDYFSEASIDEPYHRLKGYDMSRDLNYLETIDLHLALEKEFGGKVFIARTSEVEIE